VAAVGRVPHPLLSGFLPLRKASTPLSPTHIHPYSHFPQPSSHQKPSLSLPLINSFNPLTQPSAFIFFSAHALFSHALKKGGEKGIKNARALNVYGAPEISGALRVVEGLGVGSFGLEGKNDSEEEIEEG
jgi:hypothetical protein